MTIEKIVELVQAGTHQLQVIKYNKYHNEILNLCFPGRVLRIPAGPFYKKSINKTGGYDLKSNAFPDLEIIKLPEEEERFNFFLNLI